MWRQEEDAIKAIFSANFRPRVLERHGSFVEFSREIGVHQNTVNQWATGVALPTAKMMALVVRSLGVHVSELFRDPSELDSQTEKAMRLAYARLQEIERASGEARAALGIALGAVPRETIGGAGKPLDDTRPTGAGPDDWGDENE